MVECFVVGVILAFGLGTLGILPLDESAQGGTRRQVKDEDHLPGIEPVIFNVPASWEYSAPLIAPAKRQSNPSRAQKDPTVVFYGRKWHVFMTVKLPGRSAIEYCSFENWEHANGSERTILKISDSDYYCAPQVFYFTPHKKWYLIYQMGAPGASKMWVACSTTTNIADPDSWTQARPILDGGENDPREVGGLDYWIICDNERAYLFLTSLNGKMWRLWTHIEDFPRGFDHCELALEATIFEASHTYKLKGMDKYLTVIEENGRRYYKAYLADRLDGSWTPIADTAERPFAGWKNVRPAPGVEPWTDNISHGELIRDGFDQTLTVDSEDLRFIFQGMWDKDKSGRGYGQFQWRIGMLRPVRARRARASGHGDTDKPTGCTPERPTPGPIVIKPIETTCMHPCSAGAKHFRMILPPAWTRVSKIRTTEPTTIKRLSHEDQQTKFYEIWSRRRRRTGAGRSQGCRGGSRPSGGLGKTLPFST